jgi:hypothetical protein
MAVRTVRRGGAGMLYSLVFFIFLSLVAIGLAVLFYSDFEKQRKVAEESQADLKRFVNASEMSQPDVRALLDISAKKNRSAIQSLKLEIAALKTTVTGEPNLTSGQVEEKLKAAGLAEGTTVLGFISTARDELAKAKEQLAQLDAKSKEADARLLALGSAAESATKDREGKIADYGTQVTTLGGTYNASQKEKDEQLTDISKKLGEQQGSYAEQLKQREAENKALTTQVGKLAATVAKLRNDLAPQRVAVPDPTKEVDGRIISVEPAEKLVYIDIGRKDHLVLGTTFEVFDATRGVEVSDDGKELKRGKASIEVVTLNERSAACRITRSNYSQPLLVNDVIANLVYDRTRALKFYVFGDFDLDNDGQATLSDREMVLAFIRDWGGVLVKADERQKNLTALLDKETADQSMLPVDTDFVVIGKEPELPKPVAPGETRPEVIRDSIQAKAKWDAYIRVINEARTLSIPVVNQNRFLALIGYYQR